MVNVVPPEDPKFNGKYDSIYNHSYGTPAGTLGINCRHMLIPYTEGVNTNHQPQYDPEEAIKNGKLVQQQRARERAIREAKKRLKVAEELGDEAMVNQTKTLLRARQKKLREFISQTNADRNVPILMRDYNREKIITRGSKFKTAERELISEKSTQNEFSTRFFLSEKVAERRIVGFFGGYLCYQKSNWSLEFVSQHAGEAKK